MPIIDWIKKHPVQSIYLALAGGIIPGVVFAFLVLENPRMVDQPSMSAYERTMPQLPDGVVLLDIWSGGMQPEAERATVDAAGDSGRGEVYYRYYCIFCHGGNGRGDGPVGQSYIPKPTDLTSMEAIDTDKLRSVIADSIGHAPVLGKIIPVDYYPDITAYIRMFSTESGE